jgi:Leucine-rich repeat (LRR) protein
MTKLQQAQKYLDENCPKKKRKEIESIDISNKNLEGHLDLSDFPNLRILDCSHNSLTSLELRICSKLEYLDCGDNRLRQLELRGLNGLKGVNSADNYLSNPESLIQLFGQLRSDYKDLCAHQEKLNEDIERITGVEVEDLPVLETSLGGKTVAELIQINQMNESRVSILQKENSSLRKRIVELMGENQKLTHLVNNYQANHSTEIINDYLFMSSEEGEISPVSEQLKKMKINKSEEKKEIRGQRQNQISVPPKK